MSNRWRLIVVEDERELAKKAATWVRDQLKAKPDSVLTLPTGRTPLGMYNELVKMSARGEVDLSRATVFNLDEFFSLPSDHPASFSLFLKTHLLDRLPVGRAVLFDGMSPDPAAECARVEAEIRRAGGIDLAILGIGENGHIAFNEPGSSSASFARLVALTEMSRWANRLGFSPDEEVPYTALTLGISDILQARSILILAAGRHKAHILRRSLCEPPTDDVPASLLRQHADLTVIADRQAAATTHCGMAAGR